MGGPHDHPTQASLSGGERRLSVAAWHEPVELQRIDVWPIIAHRTPA
jgi:hypothetical protein